MQTHRKTTPEISADRLLRSTRGEASGMWWHQCGALDRPGTLAIRPRKQPRVKKQRQAPRGSGHYRAFMSAHAPRGPDGRFLPGAAATWAAYDGPDVENLQRAGELRNALRTTARRRRARCPNMRTQPQEATELSLRKKLRRQHRLGTVGIASSDAAEPSPHAVAASHRLSTQVHAVIRQRAATLAQDALYQQSHSNRVSS